MVVLYRGETFILANGFSYLHLLEEGWSYSKEIKEPEVEKPGIEELVSDLEAINNEIEEAEKPVTELSKADESPPSLPRSSPANLYKTKLLLIAL